MGRIGRCDDHGLNVVRRDQRSRAGKYRGAVGGGLSAGGVGVEDARKMRARDIAFEKARMFGSHNPRSDETDADAHFIVPLRVTRTPDAVDAFTISVPSRAAREMRPRASMRKFHRGIGN